MINVYSGWNIDEGNREGIMYLYIRDMIAINESSYNFNKYSQSSLVSPHCNNIIVADRTQGVVCFIRLSIDEDIFTCITLVFHHYILQ